MLVDGELDIGGLRRTYHLARGPRSSPLLIALHGLGMSGPDLDAVSGLSSRGPAAGFATVFPDGWGRRWDPEQQVPGRQHVDDDAFISTLVRQLVADGVTRDGAIAIAGISNGAVCAESLARRSIVPVGLLALVSGTAREDGRRRHRRPLQSAAVVCFAGTADRSMPYGGGEIGGSGTLARLAGRVGRAPSGQRPVIAPVEDVASEWAAANGIDGPPTCVRLEDQAEDLAVTLLSWNAPGCRPVQLYRIEGGGHGWPGGPQRFPAWLVGRISSTLDATGLILRASQQHLG